MSGDFKYEAQVLADEMAEEEFVAEFYSLTSDQQCSLYQRALDRVFDGYTCNADNLRKAARER